jgi:enoyl-CoA hydratase/carnithine racemase
VIAKVNGIATAAGCQLVASCDLVVATERSARDPGVRIGLFCSTPMVPISRAIGRKRAMQMLLTGDPIDARTAADWGLVNQVVSEEDLEDAVAASIERITRSSPLVIGISKEAFYEQIELDEHGAYELTKDVMARTRSPAMRRTGSAHSRQSARSPGMAVPTDGGPADEVSDRPSARPSSGASSPT